MSHTASGESEPKSWFHFNPAQAERDQSLALNQNEKGSSWNINPILRLLLLGSVSKESPLRRLRGQTKTLLKYIYGLYLGYSDHWEICSKDFKDRSELNLPEGGWHQRSEDRVSVFPPRSLHKNYFLKHRNQVEFPPFQSIYINMMPLEWEKNFSTLPDELLGYKELLIKIYNSFPKADTQDKKIVYLTIDERKIKKGNFHRRPGLHIESPGVFVNPNTGKYEYYAWGCGVIRNLTGPTTDGIVIASNIDNSCAVYDCILNSTYLVNRNGLMSKSLISRLPAGTRRICEGNRFYWLTDRTPHESLQMEEDSNRQFIRIVLGKISVWYKQHNTPNPKGVLPDAPIDQGNKFA